MLKSFSVFWAPVSRRTERLNSFVEAVAGKRVTYEQLTQGKTWFDAEGGNNVAVSYS